MNEKIAMTSKAKIRINYWPFSVRRARVSVRSTFKESPDSTTYPFKLLKFVDRVLEAEISFFEATDLEIHGAKFAINEGSEVDFRIYPKGIDHPFYHSPYFFVERIDIEGEVGAGPVIGTIIGHSNGAFYKPSQT